MGRLLAGGGWAGITLCLCLLLGHSRLDDFGNSVECFFQCSYLPLFLVVNRHEQDLDRSFHQWSAASTVWRGQSEQNVDGARLTTASHTEHDNFVYDQLKVAVFHFLLVDLFGAISSCNGQRDMDTTSHTMTD